MRRSVKIAGALLVALLLLQFFQPDKNNNPVDPELDMLILTSPSEEIASMLKNACYDCHSGQTVYPWYSKISPVSWYLQKHIHDGKEEMNYSDFGSLDKVEKIGALSKACDVVDAGTMPLQSYGLIHKDARFTQEQKEAFCSWTEEEALKMMRD
jgi:hypothetical protein